MKKSHLSAIFAACLLIAIFVLQSFTSARVESAVKCRKSDTKGDYCYTSGNTVTGCANSTEKDDCANDSDTEVEVQP